MVAWWRVASSLLFGCCGAAYGQQQYVISTYAGGVAPPTPIAGTSVSLDYTGVVAVDPHGAVYFTTLDCVLRLGTDGIVTHVAGTTGPGYSGDGGPAVDALLNEPLGLAIDSAGNVFIADFNNHRIRKVDSRGIISTVAGTGIAGFSGDGGPAVNAQVQHPGGVAVDSNGNLYIADYENRRLRKVSSAGIISTIAGNGGSIYSGDGGPGTGVGLNGPGSVALDGAGNIYFVDGEIRIGGGRVRKLSPAGIISTVAGNGAFGYSVDGTPAVSAPVNPLGIAVDSSGTVYVVGEQLVRKIDSAGNLRTVAGNGHEGYEGDGVPAMSTPLFNPFSIAIDGAGNIYIADDFSYRVRKVDAAGTISTVAGNGADYFSGDGGPAAKAQLGRLGSATMDSAGNLYFTDVSNDFADASNRVRRITPAGTISTVAGGGTLDVSQSDGRPATASKLGSPYSIAADGSGNLYVSAGGRVRKISSSGIITTITGIYFDNGSPNIGDGGPASTASVGAAGLAVDSAGNLFVADPGHNRVRKIDTAGVISTVAGDGDTGYFGDGGLATKTGLYSPTYIAVDSSGNLYILDSRNNRIRKVTTAGIISTVAGNGTYGHGDDGNAATSAQLPGGGSLAVDASGSLYITDYSGQGVRKVSPDGIITTIAGNGTAGYSKDGDLAVTASLNGPVGVAVDSAGRVYVAELGNAAIRVLTPQIIARAPDIRPGGIVPVYGSTNTIQPGEWISIYGTNLATSVASWNGTFSTSLVGTSVTINNKPAFLSYAGPTQLNVQAPDDSTTGPVTVVVTTPGGSTTSTVTLASVAPSFLLVDNKHVAGIILRPNGSGSYGNGSYDLLGPHNITYPSKAAKVGDSVALFAAGLGPTSPNIPAGQVFTGAARTTTPITLLINNQKVTPTFTGLSGAGLYQINFTVPAGLGSGDVPLSVVAGAVSTQAGVVISLQ